MINRPEGPAPSEIRIAGPSDLNDIVWHASTRLRAWLLTVGPSGLKKELLAESGLYKLVFLHQNFRFN